MHVRLKIPAAEIKHSVARSDKLINERRFEEVVEILESHNRRLLSFFVALLLALIVMARNVFLRHLF